MFNYFFCRMLFFFGIDPTMVFGKSPAFSIFFGFPIFLFCLGLKHAQLKLEDRTFPRNRSDPVFSQSYSDHPLIVEQERLLGRGWTCLFWACIWWKPPREVVLIMVMIIRNTLEMADFAGEGEFTKDPKLGHCEEKCLVGHIHGTIRRVTAAIINDLYIA